jgi:hypothetical protein
MLPAALAVAEVAEAGAAEEAAVLAGADLAEEVAAAFAADAAAISGASTPTSLME